MYAQSHAVPWTQEYDQEESYSPTHEDLLMHCYVERYKYNEFIEIYRV